MKLRKLLIFLAPVLLIAFVISFHSKVYAATILPDSDCAGNVCLGITLTGGTGSASAFVVKGTVNGQTITFQYAATLLGQKNVYWAKIPATGGAQTCTGTTSTQINTVKVTVTNPNGQGNSGSYNLCGAGGGNIDIYSLAVSAASQPTGSVTGAGTYVSVAGQSEPITNDCIQGTGAVLAGPNNASYNVTFDSGGNYSVSNLPPGSYTLTVNCVPTDPADNFVHQYTDTFTLTAGQSLTLNFQATDQGENGAPTSPTAASTATPSPTLQCTISIFNPLTWLVCPIISAAEGFVGQLDNAISDLLNVDVGCYLDQNPNPSTTSGCRNGTGPTPGQQFYQAWDTLRVFAMALIVIIALIMIIMQAVGVETLSAYSVRKVLPRLLIAIIAITLSWDLMKFAVQLTDDLGHSVADIIYAPFGGSFVNGVTKINGAAISGLGIVGAGGLLVLGIVGALSFVAMAAISVLVAFAFLVLRKMLILVLIIMAPIAIACAILPNTQRVWKFWSDNFMRALIMFPLIEGFIAIGRVFAGIAGDSQTAGLEQDIIKLVAWFGPYFMIPTTFKMAGGIMGTIGGLASNIQSRANQPLAAFRKNQRAQRAQRAREGNLFRGVNPVSKKASTLAQGAMMANKAGFKPNRWRTNMRTAMANKDFDDASKAMEENESLKAMSADDDKLWALMNGKNEQQVRDELLKRAPDRFKDPNTLNEAVSEVMRTKKELGAGVAEVAAFRLQGGTGTGFNYRDDGIDDDFLSAAIRVSHGNQGLRGRMIADARTRGRQSERPDFAAGGFARTAVIADDLEYAMAHRGHAPERDETGKIVRNADGSIRQRNDIYDAHAARRDIYRDVIKSNAGGAIAGKVKGARPLMQVMKEDADFALYDSAHAAPERSGEVMVQELASIAGKKDAVNVVAPQNGEAFDQEVMGKTIDVGKLSDQQRELLMPAIAEYEPVTESVTDAGTGQVTEKVVGRKVKSMKTQITYQQALDTVKNNETFLQRRYEIGRSTIAQAQAEMEMSQHSLTGQVGGVGSAGGGYPGIGT